MRNRALTMALAALAVALTVALLAAPTVSARGLGLRGFTLSGYSLGTSVTPPKDGLRNITVPLQWRRWVRGWGLKAPWLTRVEVSEEFKARVEEALYGNPDARALIEEGYNITSITPAEVKALIQGDGTVVLRVTRALVVLAKNNDRALALVDLQHGVVVKLVIAKTYWGNGSAAPLDSYSAAPILAARYAQ